MFDSRQEMPDRPEVPLRQLCPECRSRVLCTHTAEPAPPQFNPRHRELVRLVGKGLSDKEIASFTGLKPGSVRVYISDHILPALGLTSRVEIAIWAHRHQEQLA